MSAKVVQKKGERGVEKKGGTEGKEGTAKMH